MKAGKMPLFDWAAKSDGRHDASSEAAEDLLGTKLRAAAGSNVGCANLRDLVRDLAVRGRLVPQEPGDRSAENVLAQMAKERSAILKKRGTNTTASQNLARRQVLCDRAA